MAASRRLKAAEPVQAAARAQAYRQAPDGSLLDGWPGRAGQSGLD